MADVEDRLSGKRGKVFYDSYDSGDDQPPTQFIAVTTWQARMRKHYQDTTNSTNYHPDQALIYPSRVPAALDIEATIEGWFHINTTPYTFIKDLYNGEDEPSRVRLDLDEGQTFADGYYTIHDFSCEAPVQGVVSYRAVIRSYGAQELPVFTPIEEELP